MAFTPKNWIDGLNSSTKLNAASLIDLETRLSAYTDSNSGSVTPPPATDSVRYISGTGNDSNSGLTQVLAMRTLAAAYSALPSTGGTIYLLPGRYNVGAGFSIARAKPVELVGLVRPAKTLGSASTTPIPINAAVIYTGSSAVSLINTTGGTAAQSLDGCKFRNLVFELSDPATLYAINATQVNLGEITDCVGFLDKTTGSGGNVAAVLAWIHSEHGGVYGGSQDASWWILERNSVTNMGLFIMGNPTGASSCNRNWISRNYGNGRGKAVVGALPLITLWSNHGTVVRDNNFEAYATGLKMDNCWMCMEDGDAGEFVDYFVDMYGCKGCRISPLGASYAPLGSTTPYNPGTLLVRGDAFTKACIFILPATWTSLNTQRVYNPTDDVTNPAISMGSTDNLIISNRYSTDIMSQGGTFTSTPGNVTTLNIAHGLGTTPKKFTVLPANANARDATAKYFITADATNIILNLSPALIAGTSYSWQWTAQAR